MNTNITRIMNMKRLQILWLLLSMVATAEAQVILNPLLPQMGLTMKSQLWNLSVVNSTNQDIQGQVQVLMTNVSNNQKVLSGSTRYLLFPRGLKQLSANEVMPVTYNVLVPSAGVNAAPDGFLPVGVYDVCYTLMKMVGDHFERMAEQCETVEIQPLGPPQLAYPGNNDEVDRTRPLFTWIPPSPISAFSYLTYGYTLVQVQSTQSPADAVQKNIPLASAQNINPTNYPYPPALPELDTGKLYAWQIVAFSAGSSIARSDVWTFRVKKKDAPAALAPVKNFYTRFQQDADGSAAICRGTLFYEYNNAWNDEYVQLKLYDISTANRQEIPLDSAKVLMRYGQNLKQIEFLKMQSIIDKHTYLLELLNGKNERWYLKLEYRRPL